MSKTFLKYTTAISEIADAVRKSAEAFRIVKRDSQPVIETTVKYIAEVGPKAIALVQSARSFWKSARVVFTAVLGVFGC